MVGDKSSKDLKKDVKKTKEKKKSSDEIIGELRAEFEGLKNDYLRKVADFDNFRKRKEKEMSEARERAIVNFVLDILPSIDNFEMSLKMTDNREMFIKGVEMIHKNLIDTLKENHFDEYVPEVGEVFDPYKHEPVLIENKEAVPGKILGVLQKGYLHKDSVVRPARVQVAKELDKDENKK